MRLFRVTGPLVSCLPSCARHTEIFFSRFNDPYLLSLDVSKKMCLFLVTGPLVSCVPFCPCHTEKKYTENFFFSIERAIMLPAWPFAPALLPSSYQEKLFFDSTSHNTTACPFALVSPTKKNLVIFPTPLPQLPQDAFLHRFNHLPRTRSPKQRQVRGNIVLAVTTLGDWSMTNQCLH